MSHDLIPFDNSDLDYEDHSDMSSDDDNGHSEDQGNDYVMYPLEDSEEETLSNLLFSVKNSLFPEYDDLIGHTYDDEDLEM